MSAFSRSRPVFVFQQNFAMCHEEVFQAAATSLWWLAARGYYRVRKIGVIDHNVSQGLRLVFAQIQPLPLDVALI